MSLINTIKTKVQSKFNMHRMVGALMEREGLHGTIMGEKNYNKAAGQIRALIMANKPKDAMKYAREQGAEIERQKMDERKMKQEHREKVSKEYMKDKMK